MDLFSARAVLTAVFERHASDRTPIGAILTSQPHDPTPAPLPRLVMRTRPRGEVRS